MSRASRLATRMSHELDDSTRARWEAKKAHYQDEQVVARYDEERFRTAHERASTDKKWRAIRRVLGAALGPGTRVLDVPCGRGRFTRRILEAGCTLVSADLSLPMLAAARQEAHASRGPARTNAAEPGRPARFVRADAERLPFADGAFDVVLSIRFLFHVPRELRAGVLAEMARVSRKYVVVDVRQRYCLSTQARRLRAWLARAPAPSPRASLSEIDRDLAAAGLVRVRRVWLAPLLSEKMLVVAVRRAAP